MLLLGGWHRGHLREPRGPPGAPTHAQGGARRVDGVRSTRWQVERAHLSRSHRVPLRQSGVLHPINRQHAGEYHHRSQPIHHAADRQEHLPRPQPAVVSVREAAHREGRGTPGGAQDEQRGVAGRVLKFAPGFRGEAGGRARGGRLCADGQIWLFQQGR